MFFNRVLQLFSNTLWGISSIRAAGRFSSEATQMESRQREILSEIIEKNKASRYGADVRFESVADYEEFANKVPIVDYHTIGPYITMMRLGTADDVLVVEPVDWLEQSLGKGITPRLIPSTASHRQDVAAAIAPWMGDLFMKNLSLFRGSQYWIVAPDIPAVEKGIPDGLRDDREYQNRNGWLSRRSFTVSSLLSQVENQDAFDYLTLLFMLRDKNLSLIWIWHPSYLTALLARLNEFLPSIVDDIREGTIKEDLVLPDDLRKKLKKRVSSSARRAAAIEAWMTSGAPHYGAVWPRLRVISCWAGKQNRFWIERLEAWFPGATIEPKGLMSTEGVITIPFKKQNVVSYGSHFYEFKELDGKQKIRPLWALDKDRRYTVILTTRSGLYRYNTHEIVRVTDHWRGVPVLEQLGKDNVMVDLVGERLCDRAVGEIVETLPLGSAFAMVAPCMEGREAFYTLFVAHPDEEEIRTMVAMLEKELNQHEDYHHALQIGQLKPLRGFQLTGDPVQEFRNMIGSTYSIRKEFIKVPLLYSKPGLEKIFSGEFVY